jgi:hypothetical protein
MNLSNREELIASMQQAQQPDPQAQQMAQMAQQAQLEFQQSQTAALKGQAAESQARAGKYAIETQLAPQELEIDKISAITRNLQAGDTDDREFEKRLKIAEVALKEKALNDKGATPSVNDTNRNEQTPRADQQPVPNPIQQAGRAGEQTRGPRGPNVGPAPEGVI